MAANHHRLRGFSLIELIIGIVVFSAVMVFVINLVTNQTRQSIDPILQTRAATLVKSLAAEISAKAFDQNSSFDGDSIRCGELGTSCTSPADLGPEESREAFNDVDDFNGLVALTGAEIANALGQSVSNGSTNLYEGFALAVSVVYDDNLDGVADAIASDRKLIQITITTSGGQQMDFAFYRMNY